MNHLLSAALEPVVRRRREFRYAREVATVAAALAVAAYAASRFGGHPRLAALALAGLLGAAVLAARRHFRWQPDYRQIARAIEQRHPELHALLLTAVEQAPDPATGRLHFLQERVVQQAVSESRRHSWLDETPGWQRHGARGACVLALAAATLLAGDLLWQGRARRTAAPAGFAVAVTPGDVELERGAGLVVTARFRQAVPGAATLVLQPRDAPAQRLELARNLQDPVYGGGLPEVTGDLTYRVEFAGGATRDFAVHVFEHPRLERADATLHSPAWTHLPEKALPEVRRVSGVEGSRVEVAFLLNKPVAAAWLQGKDGAKVPLTAAAGQARAELKDFPLTASQVYELHLQDAEGRANKLPETFALDVLPNRRPELKRELPRGDSRVSPLQEMEFLAKAWDDFGLLSWGLSVSLPSGETREIVLGRNTAPDERVQGRALIPLEAAGVHPDELISWNLWAEDRGPDGQPRRSAGDIYFAEVRPFEEIYHPGEAPPPGQKDQGQGEEAMKLAELQKQVIAATWNLQRKEEGLPAYQIDVPVIRESEASAVPQAEALRDKLEEPKAKAFAEEVIRELKGAVEQLAKAEPAPPLLPEALPPEKRAYAALLKLAAHEFNVVRGQPPQAGGGKGSPPQQQQLDELELKEDRNRYEAKSEAAPEQAEQAEQLALLSRLKELAQRQQDLNERLKEAQTALQAAKTEGEREQAQRQLKRLEEEEQQMLAQMDELKQSMEQATSQGDLAAERKRLEQARQEAQRAAEGLRAAKPTEALAAGTRSERELQQLRDDFRQKGAARFREEMHEMRQHARELAGKQEEIGKQLQEAAGGKKESALKALGETAGHPDPGERLTQQEAGLDQLQKEMREVSEKAEASEPLLARELYDALRRHAQAGTDETLKRAALMARNGLAAQAKPFADRAQKEVTELKEGVERAAESVLGDETDALRQARAELDQLSDQINREIARARPDLAQAGSEMGQPSAHGAGEESGAEGGPPREAKQKGDAAGTDQGPRPGDGEKGSAPGKRGGKDAEPGKGLPRGEGVSQGRGAQPSQDQQAGDGAQGESPGQGKGAQPGKGKQPGDGKQPGKGQEPGEGGKGETAGKGQGGQPGPPNEAGDGSATGSPGQREGSPDAKRPTGPRKLAGDPGPRPKGGVREGGGSSGFDSGGGEDEAGLLFGENYVKWSDGLRKVEERLEDRGLREQAAEVREEARQTRVEFKRHSKAPQWEAVRLKIAQPLAELRARVGEELARRDSREALVPIDRDPVPARYAERVRRYYEELGR